MFTQNVFLGSFLLLMLPVSPPRMTTQNNLTPAQQSFIFVKVFFLPFGSNSIEYHEHFLSLNIF